MKKRLICILAVFSLLLAACGQQEAPAMETDMDGNVEYCEYNAISVLGAPRRDPPGPL